MDRPNADVVRRILAGYIIPTSKRKDQCWMWQRYTDPDGYGQVRMEGNTEWVHRMMYLIFNGPLVEGAHVDHTCFRPSCGNPDHLRQTTADVNSGQHRRRARVQTRELNPPIVDGDDLPI